MGICSSEKFNKKFNQRNEIIEINHQSNIIMDKLKIITRANCLWTINYKNKKGIGFLCNIPFPNQSNLLPVLITNNHILDDIALRKKSTFFLSSKGSRIDYEIEIDDSRKIYTNAIYNIAIIEIKSKEMLSKSFFLNIEDNLFKGNLNNINIPKDLYILFFSENQEVKYSMGKFINIDKENCFFSYNCSIEDNPSGAPILDFSNNNVLGIHKESIKLSFSKGIFIKKPIEDFYKNFLIKSIEKNNNGVNTNSIFNNKSINYKEINNKDNIQIFNDYKDNNLRGLNNSQNNAIRNYSQNIEITKNSQNNTEDKEINLIFNIFGKELYLDVKESSSFDKVIDQLNNKYLWLKHIENTSFEINKKNISRNKTVKENGLKDNSIIIIKIK